MIRRDTDRDGSIYSPGNLGARELGLLGFFTGICFLVGCILIILRLDGEPAEVQLAGFLLICIFIPFCLYGMYDCLKTIRNGDRYFRLELFADHFTIITYGKKTEVKLNEISSILLSPETTDYAITIKYNGYKVIRVESFYFESKEEAKSFCDGINLSRTEL
jgi:hypothetical protein